MTRPPDTMQDFAMWLSRYVSFTTAGAYSSVLLTAFNRGADPNGVEPPINLVPMSRQSSLGSAWRYWRLYCAGDVESVLPGAPAATPAPAARRAASMVTVAEREQFRAWCEDRGETARGANSFLKAYETSTLMDASTWTDKQVGARRAWRDCFRRPLPLVPDWSSEALTDLRLVLRGHRAATARDWTWGDVTAAGLRNRQQKGYVFPLDKAQVEAAGRLRAFLAPTSAEDPIAPWQPGRLAPMSAAVLEAVLRGES